MTDKTPTNSSAFCTFGLDKWLESLVDVTEAPFTIYDPVQRSTLLAWERKNSFKLPEDLRNFYLSNDGIDLKWYCNNQNEHVAGQIKVCPLMQMKLIKLDHIIDAESDQDLVKVNPNMVLYSIGPADYNSGQILISKPRKEKIEIAASITSTSTTGKQSSQSSTTSVKENLGLTTPSNGNSFPEWSKFYFLDNTLHLWKLPCENFSDYFRLAILHCGVRNWHYIFTNYGLPIMTSFLLKLVSPGRLNIYLQRQKFKIDQKLVNLSDKHGYLANFDFDDEEDDEDGEDNKMDMVDSESCTTRIALDTKFIAS